MQPVMNIESWMNKLEYSKVSSGFRDGQIFAGKITKFYPHQMAEVVVNGTKVMAKMEVPVEAHVRYLFQASLLENGLVQLKVVPSGSGGAKYDLPNQLLNLFHVKNSKLGSELAEMVTSNQMAVTKESFTTALNWLNTLENPSSGLPVAKLAFMNQLPVHKTALDALLSLQTGKPLTSMLESLYEHLKVNSESGKFTHMAKMVEDILQTGKSEVFQKIALSFLDEDVELIQKAGVYFKEGQAFASNEGPNRLLEWIERVNKGFSNRPPELTAEEWVRVQGKILNNDIFSHLVLDKDNTLYKVLNSILQSLGIGGVKNQSEQQSTGVLKDILLQLMTENTPIQLKNQAENILTRLAAFQLLSQETGPIQNVFMQIPVPFPAVENDVTLQWTGRKREDGTIDPAYCKIVFYLELLHLKDTVIDMNIQNRVISLKIWTVKQEEANGALNSLLPILKENLAEKGYLLSTVKIEDFTQRKITNLDMDKPKYPASGYIGVDYKI